MNYSEADWQVTLSTGRKLRCVLGVFGLGPDGDTLYHGHDGSAIEWFDEDDPLTPAEREEIAKEMIARWVKWMRGPAAPPAPPAPAPPR